ncbi:MAG: hypothetical protein ACRC6R_02470 [Bacteroidales bacterium]
MKASLALLLVGGLLLGSCSEKEESLVRGDSSLMQLSILKDGTPISQELNSVTALLYSQGVLSRQMEDMQADEDGYFLVSTEKTKADKLIFLAGDYSLPLGEDIVDYSKVLNVTTSSVDYINSFPSLYYTAEREIGSLNSNMLEMSLTRSLARIDIKKITELNVEIDSCVLTNLADRSYLLPGNDELVESMQYKRCLIDGAHLSQLGGIPQELLYIYESRDNAPKVSIYLKLNGVKNVLSVSLPSVIERNKRYEIGINSNGAVLFANLNVLPWEVGQDNEAGSGDSGVKIDVENSEFPQGISLNTSADTLYIEPEFNGSFVLAIDAPEDCEIKMEDINIGIVELPSVKANYKGNRFELTLESNKINKPQTISTIWVKSKSDNRVYDKHLVLVREPFRTRFDAIGVSSNGKRIEFGKYVDGELARVNSQWDISSVSTRSADDQFNWLRLLESQAGYNLEGAFKPNDIDAHGQIQSSIVTVNYVDGHIEEFEISRKRNSLPVISQGGLYWAKYNMRGNSNSYEDQIGFDRDIDREELYDYLKECTDEEFAYYVGAQYRGTSREGLYLKQNTLSDTLSLHYEGYTSIADGQISNGPADAHCPPGYKMPTNVEWGHIFYIGGGMTIPASGSTNPYNTTTVSPASSNPTSSASTEKNRFQMHRHTRPSVVVDGVEIKDVSIFKITDIRFYSGESMVFLGFGNQSSATEVTLGQTIYPISTTSFSHFVIDFNSNRTSYGNLSGSGVHTRTIRCVKSPTNFIID